MTFREHLALATVGAVASLCTLSAPAQSLSPSTKWHWDGGTIVVDTPERSPGVEPVLGLTVPKTEVVRIGFVGLGMRGPSAVARFTHIPGVEIVALCDYDASSAERCQRFLENADMLPATVYSGPEGYKELCARPDINLVYVATDWDHHYPVAVCAMEHGKNVAIEVPSAMNLEQCWGLIDLSEKYRVHCFILENCCYDWFELDALNLAQNGVLGELLYAQGAYIHTLDPFWHRYWSNPECDPDSLSWRMKYNMENRGDVYPTHGLGPVAQAMDIHRGDRFTLLTAMDTKSVHGKEYVEKHTGRPCPEFRNGDHTVTLMRTANGKVVQIQHNVMNPQPYNRLYQLTGTRGMANKYPVEGIAVEPEHLKATGYEPAVDDLSAHGFLPESEMNALREKYRHPIITRYGKMAEKVGGHGGMDFFMDARLVYCLQNGLPLDMDVYDLAEWCCLAELGALSMDNNCASVAFPDFTRGHWNEVKGYSHAWAEPADEAVAEASAEAFTAAQKAAVKHSDVWRLYHELQNTPDGKLHARTLKAYNKAVAKARAQIAADTQP